MEVGRPMEDEQAAQEHPATGAGEAAPAIPAAYGTQAPAGLTGTSGTSVPTEVPGADGAQVTAEPAAAGGGTVVAEEVPRTGEPRVDAALAGLGRLPLLPVGEHPAVFEEVHRGLRDVLGELDGSASGSSGPPGRPGGGPQDHRPGGSHRPNR